MTGDPLSPGNLKISLNPPRCPLRHAAAANLKLKCGSQSLLVWHKHLNGFIAITNKATVWQVSVSVSGESSVSCACRPVSNIIRTSPPVYTRCV